MIVVLFARQCASTPRIRSAKLRIVAAGGVEHAVAMAKRHRAFAEALEHQIVQGAALGEIDRRPQPVRGEPRAAADANCFDAVHGVERVLTV